MKYIVFLSLIIRLVIDIDPLHSKSETYYYEESAGKESKKTISKIETENQLYLIQCEKLHGNSWIQCSHSYDFQQYDFLSNDKELKYTLLKKGNYLNIKGSSQGKEFSKKYKINLPWIQEFAFGLIPFVKSDEAQFKFYILNAKDFSLHKMVAKKAGQEMITLNDKTFSAQKIKVTLDGFRSIFWHGEIWFDSINHYLLIYKANEGPNTPTTTISFVSQK